MKILACTSPEAERRLRQALSGDDLQMALTFAEATSALLRHGWDVVIIGALFDESRALDLMSLLHSDASYPRVPVVGIHGAKIARMLRQEVFSLPMKLLGAAEVIDFAAIADDAGGNAEIGRRIRAAAAAPSARR